MLSHKQYFPRGKKKKFSIIPRRIISKNKTLTPSKETPKEKIAEEPQAFVSTEEKNTIEIEETSVNTATKEKTKEPENSLTSSLSEDEKASNKPKKSNKRHNKLSIFSALHKEKTVETELDLANLPKTNFTEQQVLGFWKDYLNKLKDVHFPLYNAMQGVKLSLSTPLTVLFTLSSKTIQTDFENHKTDFAEKLKKHLNNYHVQLSFQIQESKETKVRGSKEEIYQAFLEVNPLIEKLKKDFHLDLYD